MSALEIESEEFLIIISGTKFQNKLSLMQKRVEKFVSILLDAYSIA